MLNFKGMRFPIDVILVCIRWYVAYPLSYGYSEKIMEERGVLVDHLSINQWAIRFLPLIEKLSRKYKCPVDGSCVFVCWQDCPAQFAPPATPSGMPRPCLKTSRIPILLNPHGSVSACAAVCVIWPLRGDNGMSARA